MQYKFTILDHTGDTTLLLDRPKAETQFTSLLQARATVIDKATGNELTKFDENVSEMVVFGRVVGG